MTSILPHKLVNSTITNTQCNNLATALLGNIVNDNLIWKCNLSKKDVAELFPNGGFCASVVGACN